MYIGKTMKTRFSDLFITYHIIYKKLPYQNFLEDFFKKSSIFNNRSCVLAQLGSITMFRATLILPRQNENLKENLLNFHLKNSTFQFTNFGLKSKNTYDKLSL